MTKNRVLFHISLVTGCLLLVISFFLYLEYTHLAKYRSTVVNVGHNLLALRAQVTQDALNHRSDAYSIAASTVNIENKVETLVEKFHARRINEFGLYHSETNTILENFSSSVLKVTDAIDHLIGLIVIKDSVLTSLVKNVNHGVTTVDNNIQRNSLVKMLNTLSLDENIQPELASIIGTFKEIEGQKQELFSFLLSPEVTEFIEHSEEKMSLLSSQIRTTILQLLTAVFLIALFVILTYILRMRQLDKNNKEFQESMERVNRANQAKSLFLATMSHELRTPMNGVLGMAEIIKDEAGDTKTREYAQMITDSGQHLLTLLNDILDFSKIEQGKMVLENAPFSFEKILIQIEHTIKPLAHNKSIDFIIHNQIDSQLSFIGDCSRIHQILLNLAGNAIKFTEKGKVEIFVQLKNKTPTPTVEIEVSDTGIGIEEDKLEHIFCPFEQAELSTTRKFGGTGLGLAIVKQISDLMNGEVTVSSKLNVGTTFKLLLPMEIESETFPNNKPTKKVSPAELRPVLNVLPSDILLIESDRISANIIQRFLAPNSHKLNWVKDKEAAIESLKSEQYDIV